MKTLYFDCFAGASGDMILGALLALGIDERDFLEQLKLLNLTGYEVNFETVDRSGLSAIKANVKIPHEHNHRHLSHIVNIINESQLPETVKNRAVAIFTRLGEAEAKMHNVSIEKVHFHEVGAMDAIIDVVGACIGFEMLEVEKFVCSRLHVGSGMVKMAHGNFPVPPPAVTELLRNAPIYSTEIVGELVTPTGAAIIATLCKDFGVIPEMTVEQVGYGAGTREYQDFPNVLRLMLGVQNTKFKVESLQTETLTLIETNVDDLSGQTTGFVLEKAFAMGALDCWFTAIQMKKNRPAVQISILCETAENEKFKQLLFAETTTLGVRVAQIERHCLPREIVKVATEFGEIEIKVVRVDEVTMKFAPEYEQCRTAALKFEVPLRQVEIAARRAFEKNEN